MKIKLGTSNKYSYRLLVGAVEGGGGGGGGGE